MKIRGIGGLAISSIQNEVANGGKFVVYTYCISILVLSFKRPSPIYFIKSDESDVAKGLPFSLISLLLGWWGIPWGIIYTLGSVTTNFGGGKDVTADAMAALQKQTGGHVFDFEAYEAVA